MHARTKSSARGTLAPSAVASATSSYRASVHPPEDFYLIGNGVISYQIKNRLKQMLETVIMNYYYRGTTQIDDMNRPLYSCTNIHASWITGLVPGGAYY